MKYLADTHILIWALCDDPKLSGKCREILINADNTIFFSIINIWEVGLKYALHKESFMFSAETFYALCNGSGYEMLNLKVEHVFAMESLKRSEDAPRHRDPFERLLFSAGKNRKHVFCFLYSLLKDYNESVLVSV